MVKLNESEIISKIIEHEWKMFQDVNAGGPRAACQSDYRTFAAMRGSQFSAWSGVAQKSYLSDLDTAASQSRNLVREKYIRMMQSTDPVGYAAFSKDIEEPSASKLALARSINKKLLAQAAVISAQYPSVASHGRPLYSTDDGYDDTSIETYQLGELLTYSENTLSALDSCISELEKEGKSLVHMIVLNTMRHNGYADLKQAEDAARNEVCHA